MNSQISDTEILRGSEGEAAASSVAHGGPSRTERLLNEAYRAKVFAAAKVFKAARSGSLYAKAELAEAMTRSDFPLLFADVIGYDLAQSYAETPAIWPQFSARLTVPDFNPRKVLDVTGGLGILPLVPETAPYKRRAFTESEFEMAVAKRGAAIAWSWEANIDDRIGVFERAPGMLGVAAKRTEDYVSTVVLLADDLDGPATWLGTPATVDLTRANLETAIGSIMNVTDADGGPVSTGTPILLVPRSLALTAANIVNTTEIVTGTVATTGEARVAGNGLSVTPKVVVNDWLSLDQGTDAAATWYLLPDPNSTRPALYTAFLRGHETPELRVRNDQGVRPGGGAVSPEEGNFDHDIIEYRERHVVGAAPGFTDAVYVSTGA